jgi:hypothetical protein
LISYKQKHYSQEVLQARRHIKTEATVKLHNSTLGCQEQQSYDLLFKSSIHKELETHGFYLSQPDTKKTDLQLG